MDLILYIQLGIIIFLCFILVWITESSRKEREQLYNRLMARDLQDFKTAEKGPKARKNPLMENIKNAYREQNFEEQQERL